MHSDTPTELFALTEPSATKAIEPLLLAWLRQPSSVRGIHFAGTGDQWVFRTYAEIASAARSVAHGLLDRGLRKGDVVFLIQHSGFDATASFFGALLAGGVPAFLPPSDAFEKHEEFYARTTRCMRTAKPRFLVTSKASVALNQVSGEICKATLVDTESIMQARDQPITRAVLSEDLALLQFTSGSSGSSRSVRIPFRSLEANLSAIHRWLEWKEDDSTASWLPLHHDMGLVGCYLGAVTMQSDLWLLEPEHFIRSPLRYLRCFGEFGAALTALPNFALDHMTRRVRPHTLAGMDFLNWRAAIIGGESVRAASLAAFHTLLAASGFRRETLLPAYGLAEATLAVTGLPLFQGWRQTAVDSTALVFGKRVTMAHGSDRASCLVGCGPPLSGVSVAIHDEAGQPLDDGHLGEIVAQGDSVAASYLDSANEAPTAFDQGTLRTGDTGFLHQGQLYVIGRLGDSVKVRGRSVFAEDLEAALGVLELPANRLAVLAGSQNTTACIMVLVEHPHTVEHSRVEEILRARIGDAALNVCNVAQGVLRRTTSGKLRRRELWNEMQG